LAANHVVVSDTRPDFEEIFNACYEPVFRYAARRVAPEAVQDVVSETFLVAWRRHDELRGEPLPWLLGIARRVASTQRRGSARRDALRERLSSEPASPAASDRVRVGDSQLALALASLSERDREALTLVAWDGLDHRTAASVMGCSTGSLAVRLHRARRRLARTLGSSGEAQPMEMCEEARSSL
jgi:RNA polymerase sigma-70 factor (ECF subfamily)